MDTCFSQVLDNRGGGSRNLVLGPGSVKRESPVPSGSGPPAQRLQCRDREPFQETQVRLEIESTHRPCSPQRVNVFRGRGQITSKVQTVRSSV